MLRASAAASLVALRNDACFVGKEMPVFCDAAELDNEKPDEDEHAYSVQSTLNVTVPQKNTTLIATPLATELNVESKALQIDALDDGKAENDDGKTETKVVDAINDGELKKQRDNAVEIAKTLETTKTEERAQRLHAAEQRAIALLDAKHVSVCRFEGTFLSSPVCICMDHGKAHFEQKRLNELASHLGPAEIAQDSPLFALVADRALMEKLDLIVDPQKREKKKEEKEKGDNYHDDVRNAATSFADVIHEQIVKGEIAPAAVWSQVMQKAKSLLHLQTFLSLEAAHLALLSHRAGIQYNTGGIVFPRSFAIEFDIEKQCEVAVCKDCEIPLALNGDIVYDLIVTLPLQCVDAASFSLKNNRFDAENQDFGSVSLYFNHELFEKADLLRVRDGFQAHLLSRGVPAGAITAMRAVLHCSLPLAPLLSSTMLLANSVFFFDFFVCVFLLRFSCACRFAIAAIPSCCLLQSASFCKNTQCSVRPRKETKRKCLG